eukprot:1230469-Pyramimonas_sp.AAC.1
MEKTWATARTRARRSQTNITIKMHIIMILTITGKGRDGSQLCSITVNRSTPGDSSGRSFKKERPALGGGGARRVASIYRPAAAR